MESVPMHRAEIARLQAAVLHAGASASNLDPGSLRRANHVAEQLERPLFCDVGLGGRTLTVVADRLVVPLEQLDAARELLGESFRGARTTAMRAVITLAAVGPCAQAALIESLRGSGVQAQPDPVVPCSLGKKGGAGTTPEFVAAEVVRTVPDLGPVGAARHVRVAVIDTGIYYDLGGAWHSQVFDGVAMASGNVDPRTMVNRAQPKPTDFLDDGAGHGTFVAGIIRQMVPGVELCVYGALDSDGLGTAEDVADAVMAAVADFESVHGGDDGARLLVNLSLGTETFDDAEPLAFTEMRAALDPGRHRIVAAAGNGGSGPNGDPGRKVYPGAGTDVVAVASTKLGDHTTASGFTSRGSWVSFSVCGEAVVSTYVPGVEDPRHDAPDSAETWTDGVWGAWSGTSFAAPIVTGLLAHRLSAGDDLAAALGSLAGMATAARRPDLGVCLPV